MILLSTLCLFWPRKIISLFTYLRPLQRGAIQLSDVCWICHTAGDAMVLYITKFSLISNAPVSLEQTQPSLYHVSLPNSEGPFPCIWLIIPHPGKLVSKLCIKKGMQGNSNQNKNVHAIYRLLHFTGLYTCHISSPEPWIQMEITRRHS